MSITKKDCDEMGKFKDPFGFEPIIRNIPKEKKKTFLMEITIQSILNKSIFKDDDLDYIPYQVLYDKRINLSHKESDFIYKCFTVREDLISQQIKSDSETILENFKKKWLNKYRKDPLEHEFVLNFEEYVFDALECLRHQESENKIEKVFMSDYTFTFDLQGITPELIEVTFIDKIYNLGKIDIKKILKNEKQNRQSQMLEEELELLNLYDNEDFLDDD